MPDEDDKRAGRSCVYRSIVVQLIAGDVVVPLRIDQQAPTIAGGNGRQRPVDALEVRVEDDEEAVVGLRLTARR